MPANIPPENKELLTPSGGIFPLATSYLHELSSGMGFDAKEKIKVSHPTQPMMPKDGPSFGVTRHATMALYHFHNLK
jgi:hypothetical protein